MSPVHCVLDLTLNSNSYETLRSATVRMSCVANYGVDSEAANNRVYSLRKFPCRTVENIA